MSNNKHPGTGLVETDPSDPPFDEDAWIAECKEDEKEYLEQHLKEWRRYLAAGIINADAFERLERDMLAMLAHHYQN